MSQRHSMACGGLLPNGGEASKSRWRVAETRTRYLNSVGAIEKRRELPWRDETDAILPGSCLSKTWTGVLTHDCLVGVPGWHLQTGPPEQQQFFSTSDVPAAQTGWGLDIPSASTAIRIWENVLKRTVMIK